MMKIVRPSIIWVGPPASRAYQALQTAICKRGLTIVVASGPADLPEVVKNHDNPIVVACDEGAQKLSGAVAAALRQCGRQVSLFVVVERSDFGEYYDLMEQGARYYYQLSEGPETISQAVKWAAMS